MTIRRTDGKPLRLSGGNRLGRRANDGTFVQTWPASNGVQRTLASPSYSAFGINTLADKQSWVAAGGTHVVIEAYWDRLEGTQGVIDTTQLAALKQEFADAVTAGAGVIFQFATHYPPVWVTSSIPRYKAQDSTEWVATSETGNNVVDLVWSQTGRNAVQNFQQNVWNALTTAERAQIQDIRIGGGFSGELHFPRDSKWWGFSAPAQTGTDLATDQAVCPVPGYIPFSGTAASDTSFVNWYRDSLTNFMVWQVSQLRAVGYLGTIHVLHPGFGVRDNWTFGSTQYIEQAAEGLFWAEQIAAYPDAEVHPQSTWIDMQHPWDPEQDEIFGADSDKASWWKLLELATAAGRSSLIGGENTGQPAESNTDMDRIFSNLGSFKGQLGNTSGSRYKVLTWLDFSRLNAGGTNATLAHLSGYIASNTSAVLRGINVAGGEFGHSNPLQMPGVYDVDYHYDGQATFDYLASRGHTLIRLPFSWERVQNDLGGALSSTGIAELRAAIQRIGTAGMQCLPDMHNYGRFIRADDVEVVLGNGITNAQYADAWTKIVGALGDLTNIAGWDIMNEPHDLPVLATGFTGTVRYDWNDGTVQGWTGDIATASNVGGQLRLSASAAASGFFNMRKDDAGQMLGGAISGDDLSAVVTLESGTTGAFRAVLQYQNEGYSWVSAPTYSYTRVDTGDVVSGLVPGVAVRVVANYTSPWTGRAFAIQIESDEGVSGTTYTADIDDFAQGTVASASTVWKAASQAAVDAIRSAGDTRDIYVGGDVWSGAKEWPIKNGDPWITDPANAIVYQAHYYFDPNNDGNYSETYTQANDAAVAAGHANLAAMITADLEDFTTWLTTHNVRGFLGEFGWRTNTAEDASWDAVGEVLYDLMDAAGLSGTYWATGEWFGNTYELGPYTFSPYAPRSAALVIEAHPSL